MTTPSEVMASLSFTGAGGEGTYELSESVSATDEDLDVTVTQSFTGRGGNGTYLLSELQDVSSGTESTTITATNRYWGVFC